MKRLEPIMLVALALTCCTNPRAGYDELYSKYAGTYVVTDITTDTPDIYDLFDTGNTTYGIYYQLAWKCARTNTSDVGHVSVQLYPNGNAEASFFMELQGITAGNVMPPYSVDTEIVSAHGIQSWSQQFDGQIKPDGTIQWSSGVSKEDPYNVERALLGSGTCLFFDGKTMDIHYDEFPIYDYASKKLQLIHITYHLERE